MRFATFSCASLVLLGACVSRITTSTVRESASKDLSCAEAEIQVTQLEQPPKTYTAKGCGREATYRCEEWDTYEQKPVCRRRK